MVVLLSSCCMCCAYNHKTSSKVYIPFFGIYPEKYCSWEPNSSCQDRVCLPLWLSVCQFLVYLCACVMKSLNRNHKNNWRNEHSLTEFVLFNSRKINTLVLIDSETPHWFCRSSKSLTKPYKNDLTKMISAIAIPWILILTSSYNHFTDGQLILLFPNNHHLTWSPSIYLTFSWHVYWSSSADLDPPRHLHSLLAHISLDFAPQS